MPQARAAEGHALSTLASDASLGIPLLPTLPIRAQQRIPGAAAQYPLGQLPLGVGAELQQPHEHGRHVHVGFPDGEAAADEVDGGPADGAVRRQPRAGRLQQQERQRLACGDGGGGVRRGPEDTQCHPCHGW